MDAPGDLDHSDLGVNFHNMCGKDLSTVPKTLVLCATVFEISEKLENSLVRVNT